METSATRWCSTRAIPPPPGTSTFGWYGSIDRGIPLLEGPDLSSGRIPLPNSYGMQTAVDGSTHRGRTHSWNVALERRVPFNVSVDLAYVGNKLVGGLPPAEGQTININYVQHLGGGDADRPYFISHGRQLDLEIYSPYRRTSYQAMQVGVTRPFTQGLLLKGPLHAQPLEGAENRLRAADAGGAGSQLGARQRRSAAHLHHGLRLSVAMAQ